MRPRQTPLPLVRRGVCGLALATAIVSLACQPTPAPQTATPTESAPLTAPPAASGSPGPERFGRIDRYDPALDAIVPVAWRIEKLAEGFTWSEGPVWIQSGGYLLFSDVPANALHKWSDENGLELFLKPSGLANPDPRITREAGLNGMAPDSADSVLAADSGSRTVVRLELATKTKKQLADRYDGRRFSSPNDLCRRKDGTIFFTDPPYGLEGINDSKVKELAFNGVYRLSRDGTVTLVDDGLSYPNGIGLSPDERTLYVANSDRARPIWMAYALDAEGQVTGKRVFAEANDLVSDASPGAPDGLTVASNGVVFATAPGGVLLLSASGQRLGRISTGKPISNCEFGDDGRSLYLTSHDTLARIRLDIAAR